jgi:ribosomal protein S18 acetylase RimI-like enzyme
VPAVLRPANAADAPFLTEMLVVAAFWRPDGPVGGPAEVLGRPELAHYVSGWPKPGDSGVIAEAGGPVGAAWLRQFSPTDRGFGFVDADTPELSIAVADGWRGRGVGAALLGELVAMAQAGGRTGISLSVERENYAWRLYERFGFEVVDEVGGSFTMLLRLPVRRAGRSSRCGSGRSR